MNPIRHLTPWRRRLRLLRLRPFDQSTETGRSDERLRRVAITAGLSFGARVLGAAVALLTVPLTIGYLGPERYGIWLTVSSLVAMMSFADLGIGNGLTTMIAEAHGRGDARQLVRLVSSAVSLLALVAVVLGAALLCAVPFVDWGALLEVRSSLARAEIGDVVLTLGLLFFAAMPFAVVQRVQHGLQQGYVAVAWSATGTLLSLVALVVATSLRAGLVPLVLALSGAPLIIAILNSAWFFGFKRRDLRPRSRAVDAPTAWGLLRTGGLFVVLQLAASFAYSSDNLVLGAALGAASVPLLGVPAKLFSLIPQFIGIFTTPLWPAYGEAAARGDVAWVQRILRRAHLAAGGLAALGGALLVVIGPWIVERWTRGQLVVGRDVLLPLALWTVLSVWGQTVAAFLNGTGRIGVQAASAVLMATAAFGLKWALVTRFGAPGVVWATIIAFAGFSVGPLAWSERRVLRSLASSRRAREERVDDEAGRAPTTRAGAEGSS